MENKKVIEGYLLKTALWCFAAMFWYRTSLFRSLPQKTYNQSKAILWLILIVYLIFELLITLKEKNEERTVFSSVLLIYGTYTFFSYYRTFPVLYNLVIIVALLAFTGLSCRNYFRKPNKHEKKNDLSGLLKKYYFRARSVTAIACAIIVIPMYMNGVLGDSIVWKTVAPSSNNDTSEWTISANIETVSNLREEVWAELSATGKIDTLQVVANIERQYLGLPHELNVIISQNKETTYASYNDQTHLIEINIEYLDDRTAHEILRSLCHECYHSYQHRLCDVYNEMDPQYSDLLAFSDVAQYSEEFANYIDGDDDPDGYYTQLCELRARQYALQSVEEYYSEIQQYHASS